MWVRCFDIKDFFTCIPREKFMELLKNLVDRIKTASPGARYF